MRLGIFLTQKCNFKCKHCLNGCPINVELPYEEYVEILDIVEDIDNISFTGGEPLLHSKFDAIVSETVRRRIPFSVVSNGFLYTEYAFLVESKYFRKISFSLNGSEKIHDSIRKRGSFIKVIDAIEFYSSMNIAVNVIYVVVRQGYSETENVLDILSGLKIDRISLGAVIRNGANDSLALSFQQRKELFWKINYWREKYNQNIVPTTSLFSLGGVENCRTYGNRSYLYISERGELLYCCNIYSKNNRLEKINSKDPSHLTV